MNLLHPIFAMNRCKELWLHQAQHQFFINLTTMTGCMNIVDIAMNYLGTVFFQLIDQSIDAGSVAWNRIGRKDNRIARLNGNLPVRAIGNATERGHWLTLRTGTHDHDLFWRVAVDVILINQGIFWNVQIAQLLSSCNCILHAAAKHGNLAALLQGSITGLAKPVDVGGK